jgi:hypothetical protein
MMNDSSKWIRVKDEPIPDEVVLLVTVDDRNERSLEIGRVVPSSSYGVPFGGYIFASLSPFGFWEYKRVTHWQPLPELPEGIEREVLP